MKDLKISLKILGYWKENPENPLDSVPQHLHKYLDKQLWTPSTETHKYPDPKDLIDKDYWEIDNLKDQTIEYLKKGRPCNHYRGSSECRICSKRLGFFERTDGIWCWPDQLEHYIQEHDIIVPREFLVSVSLNKPLSLGDVDNKHPTYEIDDTFWVNWWYTNIRNQGTVK